MDLEKAALSAASALGGFLAGLLTSLLKLLMPSYKELSEEVRALRKENRELLEAQEGLQDALEDERNSRRADDGA